MKKQIYSMYLNGKPYGSGNGAYMRELFSDRVFTNNLYGREEDTFKVVRGSFSSHKNKQNELNLDFLPEMN
ncbi:hypothetical protein [Halobacillus litoralis]|uniref:hypothetical protein n=1 Tax=Halobacillus litoralis TaxID=45668 RepID=UPI001CD5E521|nr:hypothetical protein [Halobacillus litoralis]MCA1021481.1 hypothetical protein [Halobacillus litoralis]